MFECIAVIYLCYVYSRLTYATVEQGSSPTMNMISFIVYSVVVASHNPTLNKTLTQQTLHILNKDTSNPSCNQPSHINF